MNLIVGAGTAATRVPGPYGEEGYVRQALAPLPDFARPQCRDLETRSR